MERATKHHYGLIVLIIAVIALSSCEGADHGCGRREVWNKCGTRCQQTCEYQAEALLCVKRCYKGCVCKPGFVRRADGKCVPPADCPGGLANEHSRPPLTGTIDLTRKKKIIN